MSMETMDKIFDPFFTTKEIGKGTGQGLAIARSVVVDKHHGSIEFETVLGEGTTFIIRLPHMDKSAVEELVCV
jgi:two-component system NtrC family sensor kinase